MEENIDGIQPTLIKDKWYQKWWRPCVAFVYLFILILDFAVMPILYELDRPDPASAVTLALQFENPGAQVQALQTLQAQRNWSPITILGGGLFHVAMGAILAGSAITRGMEKRQRIQTFGGMGMYQGGGMYVDERTRTFGTTPPVQGGRTAPIDSTPVVAPTSARRKKAEARLRRMRERKGMNPDG